MGTENILFHVDVIVIDGKPLAFEDGTGMLAGAARFSNDVVLSATGDDFTKRKRVPTTFKCKLQFGANEVPTDYNKLAGVQITIRDSQSARRAILNKCSFGEMGEVGGGSVDLTFNVLSAPQWI